MPSNLSSLALVDSRNGRSILALSNNSVIDLNVHGRNITIRGNVAFLSTVGSVKFNLSGQQTHTFTDSTNPFSLFGGVGSVYNPWTPTLGNYTIEAIPYSLTNATGSQGTIKKLNISVIDTSIPVPTTNVTKVRFFPRAGWNNRMLHGVFQGSNTSSTSGYVTLATITSIPPAGVWTELPLTATVSYRYLRYLSPNGGWGNISELEFYKNTTKLTGTPFGSPGSWQNIGNTYLKAFDGDTSTFYDAQIGDGQFAGLDTNTIFVNQPPSANAGVNKSITLPTSSVTLSGSGTDPDGTITAYLWSQVNGPSTAVFSSTTTATTTVSTLVAGSYTFRLRVTDNGGTTATDDVTVTVGTAVNQAPVANAGSDKSITLPVSTVVLNGSGTDVGGTIVSYLWQRLTGPNTPTMSATNTASITLSGLIQGTYTYRLTVTDNGGATGFDDVNITVIGEPPVDPPVVGFVASPTGLATNPGTSAAPFRIQDFWAVAVPGSILNLKDGTYRGAAQMIKPPLGKSGTATQPITIRAINDGKVDIDGQRLNTPLELDGNNYMVFEGFNAHHSNYGTSIFVIVRSNNNIFRRMIGWETSDGNVNIWNLRAASNNLLEDCAGWGQARKIFGATQRADNNIFRRCFGRWEGSIAAGPKKVWTLSYNSYNNIAENCIGTWDSLRMPQSYTLMGYDNTPELDSNGNIQTFNNYQVQQPGGIFGSDGFDLGPTVPSDIANMKMFGCIAFLKQSQKYHNSSNRGNAGLYYNGLKGTTITNCVALIEPGTNHTYIYPISCEPTGGGTGSSQLVNCTRIGGTQSSFTIDTGSWTNTRMLSGANCTTVTANGGTLLKPVNTNGAVVEKRYVNGVLTTTDLFPWPMNQRIIDAMIMGGYTPMDVTDTVQKLCPTTVIPPTNIVQTAKDWLNSTGSARTALEATLAAYTTNIDDVINQLKPVPTTTAKGEKFFQTFTDPKFVAKYPSHQYHMYVPNHYTPSTKFGLMLWLHGGGSWDATEIQHLADFDMDDETVTGRSYPRTETDTSNYILVAPIAPFGTTIPHPQHASRWDVPVADQYLMDIITEVSTHYNVDFNKVVLAGFSMGGIGAFHQALRLNDRLAAVMASAGSWNLGSWASLKHTPMYIIQGVTDAFFSSTSNCRAHFTPVEYSRIAHSILTTTNTIHQLKEYPGGHSWDSVGEGHWRAFINGQNGWVTDKVRNPYRTNVVAINPWRSYELGSNFNVTWNEDPSPHTLWLSINTYGTGTIPYDWARITGTGGCSSSSDFNNWSLTKDTKNLAGGKAEATIVSANRINVTTTNVTSLSVWLHNNMINLSQPVLISINGATPVSYIPTPNLLTALKSYERRWDWNMIYHSEIKITI